ncbi:histamine H2 receptor-like [Exaiptasia diaphana]|uniref:G-protein coupled receptors family 1 profile domain-containing protein n=1 Tax=Exaiptasia diaphana TaxID=2652724 RepID=A0A913XV20_EXADI|nr:histamine H2 receptor-like [Exaiptasia diaphana]XP_028517685.1 histamine H2 receptor-like [Exaiptasia diaphana]
MNNTSVHAIKRNVVLQKHELWYWILSIHLSFLSVAGNSAVIYIIWSTAKLQTKQNAFIISLAVADLCVGLFITPTGLICTYFERCEIQLQVVFYNFLLLASMTSLIIMTLDRYIAVIYPMKYNVLVTKVTTALLIALAWIFAFFISFIRLAWLYADLDALKRNDRVYRLVTNLTMGLLPCLIVLFAFAKIFLAVRGQYSRQESQRMQVAFNHSTATCTSVLEQESPRVNHRKNNTHKHRKNSSVRVLGGIVILFVFCYSFNLAISFCEDYDLCKVSDNFRDVSMIFIYINSSVNFIVYAFLKREFHQTLNLRFRSLRL